MSHHKSRTLGGRDLAPETLMLGFGYGPTLSEGAIKAPLFQTSTFVMERMRELGMLRAVGMSRGQLKRMILKEALIQGGFGAIAAVLLNWITTGEHLAHTLRRG